MNTAKTSSRKPYLFYNFKAFYVLAKKRIKVIILLFNS